ncbi:hypothetical protein [uncultured Oxalicibacterium sp.]|uniref:hypothetical protein n=1 Tax=uncultured Oxalicibacterium sp. TaxID=1168540 RepID=UPI0025FD24D1|nr:hypothetical protein [uncultured Oxalicibacterium sp.]
MSNARHVVAIAAPIGGGKSALAQALAVALGEAGTLAFDDYEVATQMSPQKLQKWLLAGADFGNLSAPGLAQALFALRNGEAVALSDGQTLAIARHLVFEMPLGRSWPATAQSIDTLIWIDVPLDLALARRTREWIAQLLQQDPAQMQQGLRWLHDYFDQYAHVIHAVLAAQQQTVRPQADLILDGSKSIEILVAEAIEFVRTRVAA